MRQILITSEFFITLNNCLQRQNIFLCEDTFVLCLFVYSNEKKSKNTAFRMNFKKNMREEMAKVKLTDLEKAAKEECLYRNLYAYLEACVRFEVVFLCFQRN
jgi:hypothetical protein